jgi:hypothetical protein
VANRIFLGSLRLLDWLLRDDASVADRAGCRRCHPRENGRQRLKNQPPTRRKDTIQAMLLTQRQRKDIYQSPTFEERVWQAFADDQAAARQA